MPHSTRTQIFAFTTQSMLAVQKRLAKRYGRKNIVVLRPNINKINQQKRYNQIVKAKILLVDKLSLLYSYRKFLQNLPLAVIVFDNPAILHTNKKIQVLDNAAEYGILNYTYKHMPPDYSRIFEILDKKIRLRLRIKKQPKIDLLQDIIKNKLENSVFDKLNTLLYATSNVANREEKRQLLFKFVLGQVSTDKLKEEIGNLRGRKKKLLESLIDFTLTNKGKNLQSALKEMLKGMDFKTAANKYQVSSFDLQNIMLKIK